jgi:hypothetical protein
MNRWLAIICSVDLVALLLPTGSLPVWVQFWTAFILALVTGATALVLFFGNTST